MSSVRRNKFIKLLKSCAVQDTSWLMYALKDKAAFSPLARLACLRVLMVRTEIGSGLYYRKRKQLVRAAYGI